MIKIFKKIVVKTGNFLLELRNRDSVKGKWVGTQFKSDADLIANEKINSMLKIYFPGIKIISEEDSYNHDFNGTQYFLVDPIDGTASYCNGYSGFVVQISYIVEKEPVSSVIYAPVFNQLFYAKKGEGSFINDKLIKIQDPSPNSFTTIVDNYPNAKGISYELKKHFCIPNYVELGSISYKICSIAIGKADLFVKSMKPKDWDLAAPDLFLREAGGNLSDLKGNSIKYGNPGRSHEGLIATTSQNKLNLINNYFCDQSKK